MSLNCETLALLAQHGMQERSLRADLHHVEYAPARVAFISGENDKARRPMGVFPLGYCRVG